MLRWSGALVAFIGLVLPVLLQATWMLSLGPPEIFDAKPREAPQRVVIFPPVLWTYATLEQGVDHVVGIATFLARDAHDGLLDVIYPQLDHIPAVLTRGELTAIPASSEELLALHPDTVVTWKWFAEPLRAVGLPVLELNTNRKSERASMLQQWQAIAAAIDRGPREKLLVENYRQALSRIARDEEGAKPSALVISRSSAGMFLSDARENLTVAGGTRPTDAPLVGRLGDEELLRIDPDFLFLRCCAGSPDTPAALYADDHFAPMRAIKHHQVYLEPSGSFHMEGLVQEPLLDQWMAELLHPSRPHVLREEIVADYKKYYNFGLSEDRIELILRYQANKASSDYDRF